jgi:hypothetical protein
LEWLGFSVEIKARLTRIELSELSTYYCISIPSVIVFNCIFVWNKWILLILFFILVKKQFQSIIRLELMNFPSSRF